MKKREYIGYDYEQAFDKSAMDMKEAQIEYALHVGKVKSCYCTKTIDSGSMREIEIYPEFTRRKNIPKVSSESQKRLNDKNSRKQFIRLAHANFGKGDLWITLTWDDEHIPQDMDGVMKYIRNYIERLRYRRKKRRLSSVKYIYIVEYGGTTDRSHVHMLMDGVMSMDEVEALWRGGGRNTVRRINPDEKCIMGIATYLTKDPRGERRWKSSLNLKKPKVRKNHQDFTRKKVYAMVRNQNIIPDALSKKNKGFNVTEYSVYYNDVNGGFYIRARLFRC